MASAVHEACSKIIYNVNSSNLDYKMNQTHYSLHFSIRKKFTKISNSTTTDFGSLLNPQLSGNYIDLFCQELLNTRCSSPDGWLESRFLTDDLMAILSNKTLIF